MVERVRNPLQAPLFHSISFDFYDNFSTMCLILKRERIVFQSRGKHFTAERCLLTLTRFHVLWVCRGDSLSKLAGTRKRQHRLKTPVVWIYSYFAIINIGWAFPRLAFFKEGEMWKEAPSVCRILGSGGRKMRWSRYNLIFSKYVFFLVTLQRRSRIHGTLVQSHVQHFKTRFFFSYLGSFSSITSFLYFFPPFFSLLLSPMHHSCIEQNVTGQVKHMAYVPGTHRTHFPDPKELRMVVNKRLSAKQSG